MPSASTPQSPTADSATRVMVWQNGRIVTSEVARLPHLTHSFHYGLAAFEGIRAYRQSPGHGAIFRLKDHIKRLLDSAHIATIDVGLGYDMDQLCRACVDVLRANGLDEGYLRPVIYVGEGAMGIGAKDNPIEVMIAAWKWGAYLGEEGLRNGIRAKISAFQRPGHATVMSKAKITGQYVNSIMAKREAVACGADEAILLNEQGYITEASGENLFMVQSGRLVTPPLGMNILAGITRATILQIARDLGMETVERQFARDELYCADEVFLTGTAAEVTPVRTVDGRQIGTGTRGPLTEQLQRRYFETVQGREASYASWLTPYKV